MSSQRITLHRAQATLQRRVAEAPAQLADGFARLVRDVPEERLTQVLRTPIGRAMLEGIFWQMSRQLDGSLAADVDATIRWQISGRSNGANDLYELELRDARCRVHRGESTGRARVTVRLDATELVKLATGSSEPMTAFFSGKISLSGDMMFAAKLYSLFSVPRSRKQRQPMSTVSSSR